MKTLTPFQKTAQKKANELGRCKKANRKTLRLARKFPSVLVDSSIEKFLEPEFKWADGKPLPKTVTLCYYAYNDYFLVLCYDAKGRWINDDKLAFATEDEIKRFATHLGAKIENF